MAEEGIAIIGQGMVASLGLDCESCCAAARAGIQRSRHLPFAFNDVRTKTVEYAVGHQVPFLTEGFEDSARLVRLLSGALRDLQLHYEIPNGYLSALYLSLPSRKRQCSGAELAATDEIRTEMFDNATQSLTDWCVRHAARIIGPAAYQLGWSPPPAVRFVTTEGHTGVARAIQAAVGDLRSGVVETAIVAGVDSLLDEDTLIWLKVTGRLKSSAVPAGVTPGEAAALVVLQSAEAARRQACARIRAVYLRQDSTAFLNGGHPLGVALGTVLSEALSYRRSEDYTTWIVSDQNGEPFRAMDWGNAFIRAVSPPGQPVLWYTPLSFGDTGAASGAVALCVAVSAFHRGYSPAPLSIVLSAADGAERASLVVSRNPATSNRQ